MKKEFYIHEPNVHNLIAPNEVVPILLDLFMPKSVIDVGCGIGTWLSIFNRAGIVDYYGVDGDYVDKKKLQIPIDKFIETDLSESFSLEREFDLVMCLEVAEHLKKPSAFTLINTLCKLGKTIIFSAAIPGQGGQLHLNEQWPDYWQDLFKENGFVLNDTIRPLIWENPNVNWWYRQNLFVATKMTGSDAGLTKKDLHILKSIHPEMHREKIEILESVIEKYKEGTIGGVGLGIKIIINSILRKFK